MAKQFCHCCKRYVSKSTRLKHQRAFVQATLDASDAPISSLLPHNETHHSGQGSPSGNSSTSDPGELHIPPNRGGSTSPENVESLGGRDGTQSPSNAAFDAMDTNDNVSEVDDEALHTDELDLLTIAERWDFNPSGLDEGDDMEAEPPGLHLNNSDDDNVQPEDGLVDWNDDPDVLDAFDTVLDDEWAATLIETGHFTEEEMDNLRAFAMKLDGNMPRHVYNQLRIAYSHKLKLGTEYKVNRFVKVQSGVEEKKYDCCIQSCCCYTGEFSTYDACPYCTQPRYYPNSRRPRRVFSYIPLIPRLAAMYSRQEFGDRLAYRATRKSNDGRMDDVFDGLHYKTLLKKYVTVGNKTLPHKYFSDPRDIALALAADGFQIFKSKPKRGSSTATPIILINYNLPPEIRTHQEHIIPLGVIPGPKQPKDLNSFLRPFVAESQRLAKGVRAFDMRERHHFILHSYVINVIGDIPAVTKFMAIKGQNAFRPCRSCLIEGVRDEVSTPPAKTLYIPITYPHDGDPGKQGSWDPGGHEDGEQSERKLPRRSHASFQEAISQMEDAEHKTHREELSRHFGISGQSILYRLSSLDFSRSFPYDFMHLLFENTIPNLLDLWTGKFKDIDHTGADYVIPEDVWVTIGQETADAVETIPSTFVGKIPNIEDQRNHFTAELMSFWFIHLAPILLKDRFPNSKYYDHFLHLRNVVKLCIELELEEHDIDWIDRELAAWVKDYEKYYYKYTSSRLSTCPLTIHALLHVADNIRESGPVWASWAFVMERYCGRLLRVVKSRVHPYGALDKQVLRQAQLYQIKVKFGLFKELNFKRQLDDELSRQERKYPDYPMSILRWPHQREFTLSNTLLDHITAALHPHFESTRADIKKALPRTMSRWGKVRIANRGDLIRGGLGRGGEGGRDASFVRYTQFVDIFERYHNRPSVFEQTVFYGQLNSIIVCTLPAGTLGLREEKTYLLAHIRQCNITVKGERRDATKHLVKYEKMSGQVVIDIRAVEAVVGRARVGDRTWAIIDRSGSAARTEFGDGKDQAASDTEEEE